MFDHRRQQPPARRRAAARSAVPRWSRAPTRRRRRGTARSRHRGLSACSNRPATPGEARSSARSCRVQARSPKGTKDSPCNAAARSRSSAPKGRKTEISGHSIDRPPRTVGQGDADAAQIERPRQALALVARAPGFDACIGGEAGDGDGIRQGLLGHRVDAGRDELRRKRLRAGADDEARPAAQARGELGRRRDERRRLASPSPAMAQNQSPRRLSMAATTSRPRGVACASSTDVVARPASGTPSPTARPRAAARPTRTPVKLPGPMVTAISDRSRRPTPASPRTVAMAGNSRAAWSRPSSARPARRAPSRTTATPRPLTAQSKARTRLMAGRPAERWRRRGGLGIVGS